jgi:hypothetical protein
MRDAGLKKAPKKCFLFQTKVIFFCHVVTSEGILPDPSKLDAIAPAHDKPKSILLN